MPVKIPVIIGATACGKSEVGLAFAEQYGYEIVSADSRQIYRYMDIGTAKPSKKQRSQINHHLIDIRNPDEDYSAGDFAEDAQKILVQFDQDNKKGVIVGGTGFYINALIHGSVGSHKVNKKVRDDLQEELLSSGPEVLYNKLAELDPVSAQRIHPQDHYRIVRALEINAITGEPVQPPVGHTAHSRFILFGLALDRAELYKKIDRRVIAMIDDGLEEEVRSLLAMGYTAALPALQSIGYKEVLEYLEGKVSKEIMIENIQRNTRNLAKRQLTWFRKQQVHWITIQSTTTTELLVETIGRLLDRP